MAAGSACSGHAALRWIRLFIEARGDTITLSGEIKSNIWPAIQAAAALLLRNHPTGIIVDCSLLTNCTVKGAETFSDAFRYITSHNARIVVAGLAPELLEIGKSVPGVRSQLPLADSVAEARASLRLVEITPQRGRARIAAVAPMLGVWQRAVYHCDRLAVGEDCEIHLVDLMKVPRTLPIGTPLPEREAEGQRRLEEARKAIGDSRMKCFTHVERTRSNASGLTEFVKRLEADFAVISVDEAPGGEGCMDDSEAMALVQGAEFEVSLVKGAPVNREQPIRRAIVPAVGEWKHALEHACKLVAGNQGIVTLVYLVAIPRTEPLDAPKPDDEASAASAAREAVAIGRRWGVDVESGVERVRDPVLGLMRIIENGQYDAAVVGVGGETYGDYHIARAAAESLMQEPRCEFVFLRVAK